MHGWSEQPYRWSFRCGPSLSWVGFGLLSLGSASAVLAQEPVRADTIALDTTRVRRLPEINVTRTTEP